MEDVSPLIPHSSPRKVSTEMDPVEAMEMLIQKMKKTRVNAEFLLSIG
jgi:transcription termination factor Rho